MTYYVIVVRRFTDFYHLHIKFYTFLMLDFINLFVEVHLNLKDLQRLKNLRNCKAKTLESIQKNSMRSPAIISLLFTSSREKEKNLFSIFVYDE